MTLPARRLRSHLVTALAALAWVAIAWICLAGGAPEGGCPGAAHRDPVTGRDVATGGARVLADGRVLCPRR